MLTKEVSPKVEIFETIHKPNLKGYLMRKNKIKIKREIDSLEIINPNCAGIDLGSKKHWVCVPYDREKENIQTFGVYTTDLHDMAKWLKKCRIDNIVMESTGTYWIPVFNILERYGFSVSLVNARDVKNCPGRKKTDRLDCQWIQKLGTYGLLNSSFIAPEKVRALQIYMNQRESLTRDSSSYVQRIHKSLVEMNLFLHNAISDVTGKTGMRILKAIIGGERNPEVLVKYRDWRIKKSKKEIIKSLTGDYREEGVFVLSQNLAMYEDCQSKIADCDRSILQLLESFESKTVGIEKIEGSYKKHVLYRITGVDLTKIPGIDELTAQKILSKTGTDFSPWKTESHFTAWLGVSPNRGMSGGRELKHRRKKMKNSATQAFKRASATLHRSYSYLGAFFRKMKSRFGPKKATAITARKLAEIFYLMITSGSEFVEKGIERFEENNRERMIKNLTNRAKKLGLKVIKA
jgi:transposase